MRCNKGQNTQRALYWPETILSSIPQGAGGGGRAFWSIRGRSNPVRGPAHQAKPPPPAPLRRPPCARLAVLSAAT